MNDTMTIYDEFRQGWLHLGVFESGYKHENEHEQQPRKKKVRNLSHNRATQHNLEDL